MEATRSNRPLGQASLEKAATRVVVLFARDGDPRDHGPDLSRGEFGKATPAAADLQHAMSRLQVHHPRQSGVLGALGVQQRLSRRLETRRGIGHRRVQPRAIEGVAQVIVGMDIAARSTAAVTIQSMPDPVDQLHQGIAIEQASNMVVVVDQRLQQDHQVRRVPLPSYIAFRKTDIPAFQHTGGATRITDRQDGGVARCPAGQLMAVAIRQNEGEPSPCPVAG